MGGLLRPRIPIHDKTVTITTCGRISFNPRKINLSQVFAGQKVGIKQLSDRIWLVTFMDCDLDTLMTRNVESNRSITRSGRGHCRRRHTVIKEAETVERRRIGKRVPKLARATSRMTALGQ
jgi:hypothetical protein